MAGVLVVLRCDVVGVLVSVVDVVREGRLLLHGMSRRHAVAVASVDRATVLVAVFVFALLLDRSSAEDLDFAAHDHLEALATDGLVDARETSTVTPLVEFTTEGIRFELEETELAGGKETMTARGVDVSDGAVDDRGLAGTSDLGEVREQGSQVLRSTSTC